MILENVLCLFFLGTVITQIFRMKELLIFERKTTGMHIAIILGVLLLLSMTVYLGNGGLQWLTGLLGTIMLVGSMYVTGLTEDSFIYYSPTRRFIGQKLLFEDCKKIQIETFHKNKNVKRFVGRSTERIVTISKNDQLEVEKILDYNFTLVN